MLTISQNPSYYQEIIIIEHIKKFFDKVILWIGIIGFTLIIIVTLPLLLAFTIAKVNIYSRRKRLKRMIADFEKLSAAEKTDTYRKIKDFNKNFSSNTIEIFILKRISKTLLDFQEYIENKYFRADAELDKDITKELTEKFGKDWNEPEMNIYDFYYNEV